MDLATKVSNALKFTSQGGVTITSQGRPLGDRRHEIQFSVRDTGIGIAPESKDRLFGSFSQVDASTTRKYGGTGLGLAISKGLCEKMGGQIWVESEIGRGSIFSFTFLVTEVAQVREEIHPKIYALPSSALAQSHPLQILIAEDNRTNQLVLTGLLEKLGYQPDVAANGKEALEALGRIAYDLVLMDCHMPEIDGFEATRRIRENRSITQPRIVAVTASTMKRDIDQCLEAGMDGFLSKPITIQSLIQTLTKDPSPAPEGTKPLVLMDDETFMKNFSGIEDLAFAAIRQFIETLPSLTGAIQEAIRRSDPQALELAAHTLKGAVSNFYAQRATQSAERLEQMGKTVDLSQGPEALQSLLRELGDLTRHLEEILPTGVAA